MLVVPFHPHKVLLLLFQNNAKSPTRYKFFFQEIQINFPNLVIEI